MTGPYLSIFFKATIVPSAAPWAGGVNSLYTNSLWANRDSLDFGKPSIFIKKSNILDYLALRNCKVRGSRSIW
jgi:hypothetical protein